VLNVELVQAASRADRALVDETRPADNVVVSSEHCVEEVPVDVVEAGSPLAHPAFGNESAEEKRFCCVGGIQLVVNTVPRRPRNEDAVAALDLLQELP